MDYSSLFREKMMSLQLNLITSQKTNYFNLIYYIYNKYPNKSYHAKV